jgi:hypothetical protein
MQVGVPCAGGLQLKTVAVQCGSCAGILSVTVPPSPPAASVELPPQVTAVFNFFGDLHAWARNA